MHVSTIPGWYHIIVTRAMTHGVLLYWYITCGMWCMQALSSIWIHAHGKMKVATLTLTLRMKNQPWLGEWNKNITGIHRVDTRKSNVVYHSALNAIFYAVEYSQWRLCNSQSLKVIDNHVKVVEVTLIVALSYSNGFSFSITRRWVKCSLELIERTRKGCQWNNTRTLVCVSHK